MDFSVNVNPYGPSDSVLRAARDAPVHTYGDPTGAATCEVLAGQIGVSASRVSLGNGAAELLWSLARVLAHSDGPALIVDPTFSEYRSAVESLGLPVLSFRATAESQFRVDLGALRGVVEKERVQSVYLCTPNNPTGAAIPFSSLVGLADACPKTTFIVDQAFLSLSPEHAEMRLSAPANIVLLRSLTKDHAIPGLRVAYLVASSSTVEALEAARPPWTASTPAQAALLASLHEEVFIANCRERMRADREYLHSALERIGLAPIPSHAPFLITRVNDATALRLRMLRGQGILVRDCSSFGLPHYIRLASRPREDVDKLVAALEEELG